ncbi:MAG: cellulase family glycosylhydrolase [Reichenbachiella sp.]
MKPILIISSYLILIFHSTADAQTISNPNGFEIRTGVNLGLWLSQSQKRGIEREKYITKTDFDTIAALGFDHVRLPIDEIHFWDENNNRQSEAFELLHNAVIWAKESKLKIIIDLHIIRSHHFNGKTNTLWSDPKEQDKLVEIWAQLSQELIKYPNNFLAYELMNEAVADNPEDWNNLIQKLVSSVRKTEPNRSIVIGSNMWQGAQTFPYLEVPKGDKNLILSFHFYDPFGFTHYKTPWTVLKEYSGNVNYPGTVATKDDLKEYSIEHVDEIKWAMGYADKKTLSTKIDIAVEKAKKLTLPLYCGEYGVFRLTPKKPALKWYQDMVEIFTEKNIAYCHWLYKGDFPIVDEQSFPNRSVSDVITR